MISPFQEIPQVLQPGNTDLQRLRELLDEISLLRTGFPVNEGYHDQPLHQLMPELRIGKRPSQIRRRNLLGVISASQSGWNRVTLGKARFISRFTIERVPGLDPSSQWPYACQTFFVKSLCRLDACGILWAGAIENHITISGKIAMPSDHFFH
jgi:hypothetical protein